MAYNNIADQSCVTTIVQSVYTYSSYYLCKIRTVMSRFRPSSLVMSLMKQLGILRYRGRRGGCNSSRTIRVRSGHGTVHRHRKCVTARGVCKQNLISPVLLPVSVKDYITFSCQNVRSAANKSAAICDSIVRNNIDICVLTETWHDHGDTAVLSSITPSGYYYIEKARDGLSQKSHVNHGGIVFIIDAAIRCNCISLPLDIKTFEYICCKVSGTLRDFIMVAVYRPGSKPATKQFFADLTSLLEVLAALGCTVIVTGDFNIRLDRPTDESAILLNELIDALALVQHIREPTHELGGVLDLVISSSDDIISDVCVTPNGISDHSQLTWRFHHSRVCSTNSTISVRQWRNIDINAFKYDLLNSVLCDSFDMFDELSLDNTCLLYYNTLINLLDNHAPYRNINRTSNRHSYSPWFDANCKAAKSQTVKLKRRYYKTKAAPDRLQWISELKAAAKVYQAAREQYWHGKLQAESEETVEQLKSYPGSSEHIYVTAVRNQCE